MPIKICIVEDDPGLRESMASYIAGTAGFACLGAFASGEEALKAIPALQPTVVLMDINLPGMSGIQCVKRLKEKVPTLQTLMLTVYENSDRIFEALAAAPAVISSRARHRRGFWRRLRTCRMRLADVESHRPESRLGFPAHRLAETFAGAPRAA